MTPIHQVKDCPSWPPTGLPLKLTAELTKFTRSGSGLVRWYAGRTRFVCGQGTRLADVPQVWEDLVDEIKLATKERRPPGHITVREGASEYYAYLDHRVAAGTPKPLAAITAADYKRLINGFGGTQLPGSARTFADTPIDELGPDHFRIYALDFADSAPATLGRAVAALHAFFTYCKDENIVHRVPQYGRYFRRPEQQQFRDRRLAQKKSFRPEEIWALVEQASTEERAWLGLGLSGAMDNSDLAHLTFGMIDRETHCIDYRRRKTGKVARLMPVHPMAWEWLEIYLRARPKPLDPAHAELVFLTPTGLPLQRMKEGSTGVANSLDYVAMRWTRLMRRAKIRPMCSRKMFCRTCGAARPAPRKPCGSCGGRSWRKSTPMAIPGGGDGRGFRSLRTTFPNYAPRGYREEVELVMGHTTGTVLLENYLEEHGVEPLIELVEAIWKKAFTWPVQPDGAIFPPDSLPYATDASGQESVARTPSRP